MTAHRPRTNEQQPMVTFAASDRMKRVGKRAAVSDDDPIIHQLCWTARTARSIKYSQLRGLMHCFVQIIYERPLRDDDVNCVFFFSLRVSDQRFWSECSMHVNEDR